MEIALRIALGLVLCTALIALLLIATATEEKFAKLLRELQISRRLSSGECDLLRPLVRNYPKDDSTKKPNTYDLVKETSLHRKLLLEGRISASEFEIFFAAHTKGLTSNWRSIAKDRIIKWLRSWKNPFRNHPNPVAQVLQTAELIERILVYIPHQDLALHVPRTCKRFRDATRTSPCLRRRLFLEPDYKCSQQIPLPLYLTGTSLRLQPEREDLRFHGIRRDHNTEFDRVLVKRLKAHAALQGVLIAQPPVHSVSMRVYGFRDHATISNPAESGVTVGDVLMRLDKMFDELTEATGNQYLVTRRFHVELRKQEQE